MNRRALANLPGLSSLAAGELVTANTCVGLGVIKSMGQPLLWCLGQDRGLWELLALPVSHCPAPGYSETKGMGTRGRNAWRGSPATLTSAFFLGYQCRLVI